MRPSNPSRTHSNDENREIEDSNLDFPLRRGSSSCNVETPERKGQTEEDIVVQNIRNRERRTIQ